MLNKYEKKVLKLGLVLMIFNNFKHINKNKQK